MLNNTLLPAYAQACIATLTELIKRLVQRLESHGEEGCCRLDARDREAIRDAQNFLKEG